MHPTLLTSFPPFTSKKEIYRNSVVYSCVNFIAGNLSAIPISVFVDGEDVSKRIFENKNNEDTIQSLLHKIVIDLLIYGSCYLHRTLLRDDYDTHIQSIKRLERAHIRLITQYGQTIGYSYKNNNAYVNENGCDILEIKHPMSIQEYCTSPVDVVSKQVELCSMIEEYNRVFISKCTQFNGILEVNGVDTDTVDKIRDYVAQNPAGRPLIFNNTTVKWKSVDSNNTLYDISGHTHVMKQIMRAFGIHPILFGLQDSHGQYQYGTARRHFWEDTIIPLASHIGVNLEKWIRNYYHDASVKWHFSSIEAIYDNWYERAEKIDKLSFLTTEEKRELCKDLLKNNMKK